MSLLCQGGEGCTWMLLLETPVFPGVALVVRARLTLDLGLFVGSPGCRAGLSLRRRRRA